MGVARKFPLTVTLKFEPTAEQTEFVNESFCNPLFERDSVVAVLPWMSTSKVNSVSPIWPPGGCAEFAKRRSHIPDKFDAGAGQLFTRFATFKVPMPVAKSHPV